MHQGQFGKTASSRTAIVHAAIRIAICLLVAIGGCNRKSESRIRIELVDTPIPQQPAPRAAQKPNLPECPDGDSAPNLQAGAPGTGDHTVILSWMASTSARSDPYAFGYCLYRRVNRPVDSNPRHGPKDPKIVPCRNCERVNVVPVVDTGCVDTVVMDRTTYYWAAATISRNRDISGLSQAISAFVPGGDVPPRSISTAYKSCRQWDPAPSPPTPPASGHP